MIPQRYILEWKSIAPWTNEAQVEQDLVISRALVEMFSSPLLSKTLAFRGGLLYISYIYNHRLAIRKILI